MDYCSSCEKPIRPHAKFCTACGVPRTAESAPAMAVVAAAGESAVPPYVPPAQPSPAKSVGFACILHLIFPGWGLFYAERLGLGFGHVLVNTVGMGAACMMLLRLFPAVLAGDSVIDELVNVSLVVIGLVLLWFYGLGLTRRSVQRYNRAVAAGVADLGSSGYRVVLAIAWLLLLLVAVNLMVLCGM